MNLLKEQIPIFEEYFKRIEQYKASLNLEIKNFERIEIYKKDIQEAGISSFEYEQILKVTRVLCQSRRYLIYCTIELYFKQDKIRKILFEFNQNSLMLLEDSF